MHAGRHYSIREVVAWTRRETLVFVALALIPAGLIVSGVALPPIPWTPIAMVGTAVAFMTGFKSNAAYGRLWEARKVWGAIVNTSRTWAVLTHDYVRGEEASAMAAIHRRLSYRHIAWLTALRHQLRVPKAWETQSWVYNDEYRSKTFQVPEHQSSVEQDLEGLLSDEERAWVLSKKNRATALLALQSRDLQGCAQGGLLTEYRQVELGRLISLMYDHQGKCERIKNFPYPRQFATLNLYFIWLFVFVLPFGVVREFQERGGPWVWMSVPLTVLVAWVFHTMDKIGEASENPFEAGPNDVPITALARTIEIDIRDLADEPDLPAPIDPVHNILM